MSLLDRVLSSKITPAPLPEIAAKLGASYDDIEDLNLPFYDIATSSYPDSYIIVKTALYTHQNASCMMLSSDLYDENGALLEDAERPASAVSVDGVKVDAALYGDDDDLDDLDDLDD